MGQVMRTEIAMSVATRQTRQIVYNDSIYPVSFPSHRLQASYN